MMEQPVLVTGGGGFIGRHLLARLASMGMPCIGFDLPGATPPDDERIGWITGDITRPEEVQKALSGVGTVFHLAAMVGDWGAETLHQQVTVEGSRNLFEAAVINNCRVVLASSIVIYGDRLGRQCCTEDTPFGIPQGPYSRAKQAQETLAWEYRRDRKMALSVVRPANVIGNGSVPWVDAVVAELRKGTPTLIGGGDYDAGLVYVENLVDIFLRAASSDAEGEAYNACDLSGVTWKRYFSDIASVTDSPAPRSIPRRFAGALALASDNIWRWLPLTGRPPITREALNLVGNSMQISMDKVREQLALVPSHDYEQAIHSIALGWKAQAEAGQKG